MSTLRPYIPADRAACLALFDSNVPDFFLPRERAEFELWLDRPFDSGESGEYFVLEDGGRVVACGGVWLDPSRAERPAGFSWGMVARDAHRRGYGSALLRFRLGRLRELGAREVHLDTSQHSAPFYARFGFREVRRVANGYGPGLDRVDMVAEPSGEPESMRDSPAEVAAQYATDRNLRVRKETHVRYGAGPDLEPRVDEVLVLRGDEALMDVGTGPGDFPGRLRAQGHRGRLVGVDLSPGMVEHATASHPKVEFVQASADALPFPDASFDVLTARHMLYHVPEVSAALAEFARVLRPGGRFLAVTNASGSMSELWDVVAEVLPDEPALAGLLESRAGSAVFSELNGEELVREAFGNVRVELLDGALVFPAPEPVLAYLESMTALQRLAEGDRGRVREALRRALAPRFRADGWRVLKRVALIGARR